MISSKGADCFQSIIISINTIYGKEEIYYFVMISLPHYALISTTSNKNFQNKLSEGSYCMVSKERTDQNLSKKKDNDQKTKQKERTPGIWYLVAGLIAICFMIIGTTHIFPGVENQLPEIYNTALTLCLSCIGLGQINFMILGTMFFAFVVFMLLYGLTKHDKSGECK
jgi:uncharacterized membrane protein